MGGGSHPYPFLQGKRSKREKKNGLSSREEKEKIDIAKLSKGEAQIKKEKSGYIPLNRGKMDIRKGRLREREGKRKKKDRHRSPKKTRKRFEGEGFHAGRRKKGKIEPKKKSRKKKKRAYEKKERRTCMARRAIRKRKNAARRSSQIKPLEQIESGGKKITPQQERRSTIVRHGEGMAISTSGGREETSQGKGGSIRPPRKKRLKRKPKGKRSKKQKSVGGGGGVGERSTTREKSHSYQKKRNIGLKKEHSCDATTPQGKKEAATPGTMGPEFGEVTRRRFPLF